MRIKVGDTVVIRSGSHKGKTGKVTKTLPSLNKVVVDGINIVKRHRKPQGQRNVGGVFEEIKPIDVSKVGIVHPSKKGKTSRIGFEIDKNGKKKRVYKQAGSKEIK